MKIARLRTPGGEIPAVVGDDGWYDLGTVGLTPGPCFLKGGTNDGLVFFVDNVMIIPGQSVRLDLTARRMLP